MKTNIHPKYNNVVFNCHCGESYHTRSTIESSTQSLDICANCHPYLTGKKHHIRERSRINKFNQRYKKSLLP